VEPLVQVEDLHAYYGKSHILHGVSLSSAGRGRRPARPQWRGQEHDAEKASIGLVAARQGRVLFDGRAVTGMPAHKLARIRHRLRSRGPAHLPPADGHGEPSHRLDRDGLSESRRRQLLD